MPFPRLFNRSGLQAIPGSAPCEIHRHFLRCCRDDQTDPRPVPLPKRLPALSLSICCVAPEEVSIIISGIPRRLGNHLHQPASLSSNAVRGSSSASREATTDTVASPCVFHTKSHFLVLPCLFLIRRMLPVMHSVLKTSSLAYPPLPATGCGYLITSMFLLYNSLPMAF